MRNETAESVKHREVGKESFGSRKAGAERREPLHFFHQREDVHGTCNSDSKSFGIEIKRGGGAGCEINSQIIGIKFPAPHAGNHIAQLRVVINLYALRRQELRHAETVLGLRLKLQGTVTHSKRQVQRPGHNLVSQFSVKSET